MIKDFLDLCDLPIAGYVFLVCIVLLAVVVLADITKGK